MYTNVVADWLLYTEIIWLLSVLDDEWGGLSTLTVQVFTIASGWICLCAQHPIPSFWALSLIPKCLFCSVAYGRLFIICCPRLHVNLFHPWMGSGTQRNKGTGYDQVQSAYLCDAIIWFWQELSATRNRSSAKPRTITSAVVSFMTLHFLLISLAQIFSTNRAVTTWESASI